MTVDSRSFRRALGCFPTGVAVVTTIGETGDPAGVTVSSFTSLSLDPPLILFCLDNSSANLRAFLDRGFFAVNVLREEQREVSIRFASRSEQNRFAELRWEAWDTGAPIIAGCLASLECRTVAVHPEGDHHIIVGRVERLESSQAGQPLLYFRGTYAGLGGQVE